MGWDGMARGRGRGGIDQVWSFGQCTALVQGSRSVPGSSLGETVWRVVGGHQTVRSRRDEEVRGSRGRAVTRQGWVRTGCRAAGQGAQELAFCLQTVGRASQRQSSTSSQRLMIVCVLANSYSGVPDTRHAAPAIAACVLPSEQRRSSAEARKVPAAIIVQAGLGRARSALDQIDSAVCTLPSTFWCFATSTSSSSTI